MLNLSGRGSRRRGHIVTNGNGRPVLMDSRPLRVRRLYSAKELVLAVRKVSNGEELAS